MRKPHYLPANKSCELPANALWFDTETTPVLNTEREEVHHLNFGWAAFRRRRDALHWCQPEWLRFDTREDFWDWVIAHCRDRCRLYLFAHNGQFDLPVMAAFTELPNRGFKLTNAIVECPPMVLTWKRGSQTIRFIDTLNLWRVPLEKIGEHVGLPKLTMPDPAASREDWDAYGKRDTEIIMEACLNWWRFIRDNDLGGFAPTLAGQAFTAYRHRFMPVKIFCDDKPKALELARQAYLGGRVECFRLGEYEGRFYHLDVNSMYPSVMAAETYPVSLVGVYSRGTPEQLGDWLDRYRIIADVTITTRTPCYPQVLGGRLCFPTGRLRVQLSSPELEYALAHDHLKQIHAMAIYKAARPFRDFVEFFYAERLAAAARGDDASKWFIRILLNSLYGKFGQRGRRYETEEVDVDPDIKTWTEINAQTLKIARYRQFGGLRQHWVEEGEARHSHPAIAAHVTAYARCKLWSIIQRAGRGNVYYCDTDCVVVNQAGHERLTPLLHETKLGALKLEATYNALKLDGPKDYRFDDKQVTKGVRRNARWLDEATVQQVQFVGFKGLLKRGSLEAPIVRQQVKHLNRTYTKGRVQPDGRVLPLRRSDW